MGTNKGEMAIKVIAALVLCLAVTALTHEVHELDDNQAARAPGEDGSWPNEMHNRIRSGTQGAREGGKDTWGRRKGDRVLNMPGAPYGKPGYKESHNWESDVDLMSPVVFDWRFYKASSANIAADQDEVAVKEYWVNTALASTRKYPNCDQASEGFAPDMYYRAQKNTDQPLAEDANGEISCLDILKDFLSGGIFTGKKLTDPAAEAAYAVANPSLDNRLVFENIPIKGEQVSSVASLAAAAQDSDAKGIPSSNELTFMFEFKSQGAPDMEQAVFQTAYNDGRSDDPANETPVQVPVLKVPQPQGADANGRGSLNVKLGGEDGTYECSGVRADGTGYIVDGWNSVAIRVGGTPRKMQIWVGAGAGDPTMVKECDAPNNVVAPPTQTSMAKIGVPEGMPPSDAQIGLLTEATSYISDDLMKFAMVKMATAAGDK